MYQHCISYTSGDTVVFMKVFFLIFSLFRQIVRHHNSSTIGHRDFRFETLNRLCNNIPHANIYFYVLRTKTVKRPKNCQHILNYKSRTTRRREFWFGTLIGPNIVYLRFIFDFKFCAHKWIRGQKTAKHSRHYNSRATHHSDV